MTTKKTTSNKSKKSSKASAHTTGTHAKAKVSPNGVKTLDTRVIRKCLSVTEHLLRDFSALTEVERKAQRSRFSDERCDRVGADTQSQAVLRESVDWAVKIHKALKAKSSSIRSYSQRRFVFLLECIVTLAKECTAQAMKQNAGSTTKMMLEYAHEQARDMREELLEVLRHVVGDDTPQERDTLAQELGSTKNADTLAESLGRLATLAKQWIAYKDPIWKIRIEDAGLTSKLADEAMQAASLLSQAAHNKTLHGTLQPRDTPEVNRIEGRVVLEMAAAMRAFAEANARDKTVPKLTPGPATRHVLVHKRKDNEDPTSNNTTPIASDT